jgi:uncharacterized protein (TIGR01244 family)
MKINGKAITILCLTLFIAVRVLADNKAINKYPDVKAGSPSPIDLPNVRVPFDHIVTGGQPTYDQLKRAGELGFKTIINLRTDAEQPSPAQESSWVKELGMKYISIPVDGAKGLNLENSKLLEEALSRPEDYPLIVHCAGGNRVGALFSLKAFHIEGKSAEEAVKIGEKAGLGYLERVVQKILKR